MTRDTEAGFTLIEMMIVVVMIGVLAAIALPLFTSEANESKAATEVQSMFSKLRIAQEQYKLENGVFLSTGADENDTFPATPTKTPQSLATPPATWDALKFVPPQPEVRCGYVAIAGPPGGGTVGAKGVGFGFAAPQAAWYYLLAHCDIDGDGAEDAFYFTSSVDSQIQSVGEGH
ncbi:MAG: prepilin-type N-terminal cleavage/methylation domain-containing protein [Deltaproteobacteria bacterium]|nr:prepilin-type N-terminal cleavage/methylation domain-containing protein [Deltaproteobacteria bacterium]